MQNGPKTITVTSSHLDCEMKHLDLAAKLKEQLAACLVEIANARKARGAAVEPIEDSIDLENMTRAGYQMALKQRARQLANAGIEVAP